MPTPKILIFPGSTRTGSHNVRLAALAAKELASIDIDVTRISLADYPQLFILSSIEWSVKS